MASGVVLQNGQEFILDAIKYYVENASGPVPSGSLWVGLFTDTTSPTTSGDLGSGITELAGATNYTRQESSSWIVTSGVPPYMEGSQVEFPVSGTWSSVNGYFVSTDVSGVATDNVLWAELFPVTKRGDKEAGFSLYVTPRFVQRNQSK